jgi:hypothetical protein
MANAVLEKGWDDGANHAGDRDHCDEQHQFHLCEAKLLGQFARVKNNHRHACAIKQRGDHQQREIAVLADVAYGIGKTAKSGDDQILSRQFAFSNRWLLKPNDCRDGEREEPESGKDKKWPPTFHRLKTAGEHQDGGHDQQKQRGGVGAGP